MVSVWRKDGELLSEAQTLTVQKDGKKLVNGLPRGKKAGEADLAPVGYASKAAGGVEKTGPLGPFGFLRTMQESEVILWSSDKIAEADGSATTVYYQKPTAGSDFMAPGSSPTFKKVRSAKLFDKLDFLSLMLALFCGTASLPHILIRYYTVKDQISARKSTVVGIAAIGFFYVLTLFLGLGAMTSGKPRCHRLEHVRAAAGAQPERIPLRGAFGRGLHHGAGHGQRPDHGRQRRGRP